jgi:hypothetical protein
VRGRQITTTFRALLVPSVTRSRSHQDALITPIRKAWLTKSSLSHSGWTSIDSNTGLESNSASLD